MLRLFAPFLPYATEEVWTWWREGSVHREQWPAVDELPGDGDVGVLATVAEVLRRIRRAKTEAKRSMRTPVTRCAVRAGAGEIEALRAAEKDLREAGVVADLVLQTGDGEIEVEVELEPPESA